MSLLAGEQEILLSPSNSKISRSPAKEIHLLYGVVKTVLYVSPILTENHTTLNNGGTVELDHRKSWRDNLEKWTGQSLPTVMHIADDRSHHCADVCWLTEFLLYGASTDKVISATIW